MRSEPWTAAAFLVLVAFAIPGVRVVAAAVDETIAQWIDRRRQWRAYRQAMKEGKRGSHVDNS